MRVTRSRSAERFSMQWVMPGAISTTSGRSPETRCSTVGKGLPSSSRPTRRRRIDASPETTRNFSHFMQCQWLPLVTPGLETFTDTWPQSRVRRTSQKEPRSSDLGSRGYERRSGS